ncbi:hypothetical protein K474DRAFT_1641767 [Panus rudis PR-1116 ss-1]|nr:hypothetical protein K474DRAFT_1641767 [Panus rudis PR-1116 ss-1]
MSTQEKQNDAKLPMNDMIRQSFPPFDHRGTIVTPFDEESKRDAEFQEKLTEMLLELTLDFHAWSSARPLQESDRTADALEKEINELMEAEKEQGTFIAPSSSLSFIEKTRQRLSEFVERIKMALAALTALAP